MADPLEIASKIALHFNGHAVFQEILFLAQQFRRQVSQTLLSILTIGGTAKIHLWIQKLVPTVLAPASGVVLEEFHPMTTFGARGLKDGPRFPVTAVLSRTFHLTLRQGFNLDRINRIYRIYSILIIL
jgi:hypothetical protein